MLAPASQEDRNMAIGEYNIAGVKTFTCNIHPHAAATATEVVPLLDLEHDFYITDVEFIAGAAVTGADTNTTHLNLRDETTEKGTIDLVSGTDLAALTPTAFGVTDWTLTAGNVLNLQVEKVGNGLAVGAAIVKVNGRWS
jgi:hypothetical protein